MSVRFFRFIPFLLAAGTLVSCGPSYPKERVAESLVELCKREYGIDVLSQVVKTTIGVQVSIPGLIEELMKQSSGPPPPTVVFVEGQYEEKAFDFQFLARAPFVRADKKEKESAPRSEKKSEVLTKLDQVSTALRRVALSTDAPLEFYMLIARDPGPTNLEVVFSGHLDDLKKVQFLDISLGELQRRSRVEVRPQPEGLARETVRAFLADLFRKPLPQLLTRYVASTQQFKELLQKILRLAVELQGRGMNLIEEDWPVRQIQSDRCLVYVSLAPLGWPGAVLFTVELKEGQGKLLNLERLESLKMPAAYESLGPPEKWKKGFYLAPIDLAQFLSEQIAKRVSAEFAPLGEEEEGDAPKPITPEEVTRVLMETSAKLFHSYQFSDFKELKVTDALKGTRWAVPAKDLPIYRRRHPPAPAALP